jgi:hypothetical protein
MKAVSGITVDHVFAGYIPALSSEELSQLEENLVEHGGARDPLVVWRSGKKDILLDGHNRYEICTRLGLSYDVEPMEFGSRDEAADWIDRNQLGRRNLSKQDYKLLLGRRYNRAKKSQGAPEGNENAAENKVEKVTTLKTAERLAKEHGVNEKTVRNAGKFQAAAEKLGIEKEIAAGKVKASEAVVVRAAIKLPEAPTPDEIEEAVKAVRSSPQKAKLAARGTDPFKALPPTRCLQAISYYGSEFLERCPNRSSELRSVLVDLIASCDAT